MSCYEYAVQIFLLCVGNSKFGLLVVVVAEVIVMVIAVVVKVLVMGVAI